MGRRIVYLVLALGLILSPGTLLAQAPAADPEVGKGIKLVDEGDYDGAILTLDNAARRLAADPAKAKDLSQAYLYLGIAYVGKGHEAAAKAKFREAIGQIKDLSLSPDKFPPKVINIFEEARQEAAKAPAGPQAPAKKKGGSKGILIGVGVAAVGGGVALAAGGGGGGGGSSGPTDTRKVETFSGSLCSYQWQQDHGGCDQYRDFAIVVSASGTLEATVTWTNASALFTLSLMDQNYEEKSKSNRVTNTSSQLSASVEPQTACPSCSYHLVVDRQDDLGPENFNLTVKHP